MKTIRKLFSNALIRFGMERRMLRISTLVTLLICVLGAGGMLLLLYSTEYAFMGSRITTNDLADFGLISFAMTALCHSAIVLLLSVNSAAAEISGEKQRQTIDLLICSQMTPGDIIRGKLLSSFSYTVLISLAMLPVYAVIYLFGGISPWMILILYVLMIFFGCVVSALALWLSSVYSKSAVATLMTILFVIIVCAGNGLVELLVRIFELILDEAGYSSFYSDSYEAIPWVLQFNPVAFLVVIIGWFEDSHLLSNNRDALVEFIITLTFTPVFSTLVMLFSIRKAKQNIDPFKSNPRKG